MRRWLIALLDAVAHQQIDWWSGVASWCRRQQVVDPYEPGHSALERMRALDKEMVFRKD